MLDRITQAPITEERIREMLQWTPRRMQLTLEWQEPLHEPTAPGRDWCLTLPFRETLANTFVSMCQVDTIGLRVTNQRCWTYLRGTSWNRAPLEVVRQWLAIVGKYVAIRDCLAMTFALEYDRIAGDPNQNQTEVGLLRSQAKPYNNPATAETYAAADALAHRLLAFIGEIPTYGQVDALLAMPASDPDKAFSLPRYLTREIANQLDKTDLSSSVITTRKRPTLKSMPLGDKMNTIRGTIALDQEVFAGKDVLIIDDLYQSGVSINYVGSLLLSSGATRVLGLACEKTCRNDDNV